MRWLLFLWALPIALFWGWYFLSLYDLNMGQIMLTRQAHDVVFELYGNILGIDPAALPAMVAKACVFDSFVLAGIIVLRRRQAIVALLRRRRGRVQGAPSLPNA